MKKPFKKILFYQRWFYPVDWGSDSTPKIESYIEYTMWFDFKQGLRFSLSVPNYTMCTRNPFKCMFIVLEYLTEKASNYTRLEGRIRELDVWRSL